MDTKNFVEFSKAAIDFLVNYNENIRDLKVVPEVEPGYLSRVLPQEAPQNAEDWKEVFKDFEKFIVPGMTHWNSPNFHAYFPTGNSYPAIVGEILSAGLGCIGFSWIASPACTELEDVTMNWLGKMLALPEEFLSCNQGYGGGVIQGSASEATYVCLLAARHRAIRRLKSLHPEWDDSFIKSKLVAYTSDQSNSSVEKAGLLGDMLMKLLPSDDKCRLRGETLLKAIQDDLREGLFPCYCVATLGTTGTCAFDDLEELGPICQEYKIWMHVDAAYAGAAFICPEYRHLMAGVEYAESFNFNPHKWMLVNFDCSAMWIKDSRLLTEAFNVDRIYLTHDKQGCVPDYRHWQIPLGRRFRALKLWFVLRIYGVEGLQNHIRKSIELTQLFESYLKADSRFEITTEVSMGLVCFRLKGDDNLTKELLARVSERKLIYIIPAIYREKLVIRFVTCSRLSQKQDIDFAWKEISDQATEVFKTISMTPVLEFINQKDNKSSFDVKSRLMLCEKRTTEAQRS